MPVLTTPRRFGVEIEGFVSGSSYDLYGDKAIGDITWDIDSDGSLRGLGNGIEAKQPPLDSTEHIYSFYEWLQDREWHVNDTAGLHIHVEVADYEPHDFQKLLALMVAVEPYIYSVTDENRFRNSFCKPLSRYGDTLVDRLDGTDVKHMWEVKFTDEERYVGFNLEAYCTNRKTIEFRYFAAQEEAENVTAYVELVTKLVEFAKHATYEQILVIACKIMEASIYEDMAHIIHVVLQLQSSFQLQNENVFTSYNRSDLNSNMLRNVGLVHGLNVELAV
jgi:hypothetical protein